MGMRIFWGRVQSIFHFVLKMVAERKLATLNFFHDGKVAGLETLGKVGKADCNFGYSRTEKLGILWGQMQSTESSSM